MLLSDTGFNTSARLPPIWLNWWQRKCKGQNFKFISHFLYLFQSPENLGITRLGNHSFLSWLTTQSQPLTVPRQTVRERSELCSKSWGPSKPLGSRQLEKLPSTCNPASWKSTWAFGNYSRRSCGKNLPHFYFVKYKEYLFICRHISLTMNTNSSEPFVKYSAWFSYKWMIVIIAPPEPTS